MPFRRSLSLATLVASSALAQTRPTAVGHPARVASFAPVAEVRAFSVARANERVLLAYVQAGEADRGALHTVLLRGGGSPVTLERVGADHALAPQAVALALHWDGTHGAVVYVTPRPHRGESPGARTRRRAGPWHPPDDPLGPAALTAGDIVWQALDANGAPVGRAVTVFEENSRAFRVALAPEGEGYRVAWTGAMLSDGELQGTVRTMHVGADGATRAMASDTGFLGEVGDVLRVVPAAGARRESVLLWSGARCVSRGEMPAIVPTAPPVEVRPHAPPASSAWHERAGSPVVCAGPHVYAIEARADGTSGAVIEGPAMASDALALIGGGEATEAVVSLGESPRTAVLTAVAIGAHGAFERTRVLGSGARTETAREASADASRVPPSAAPSADDIARVPFALDADAHHGLVFAAVSPSHQRLVYGAQSSAGGATALTVLAPGARVYDVALAPGATAWLFAQTGDALGGPLVFFDGADAPAHAAPPETRWPGDERLRVALLRARAARAAYTDVEGTFLALSARPDAASNPHLPGLSGAVHRLRDRWAAACDPLTQRAHWLSRHGADADLGDVANETCDLPLETPPVVAPGAPAPAP